MEKDIKILKTFIDWLKHSEEDLAKDNPEGKMYYTFSEANYPIFIRSLDNIERIFSKIGSYDNSSIICSIITKAKEDNIRQYSLTLLNNITGMIEKCLEENAIYKSDGDIKEMNIERLEEIFTSAIQNHHSYVAVAVKNGVQHDAEIIINMPSNFVNKLDYYKKAYSNEDDKLVLNNCKTINIVGISSGNSLDVIISELQNM